MLSSVTVTTNWSGARLGLCIFRRQGTHKFKCISVFAVALEGIMLFRCDLGTGEGIQGILQFNLLRKNTIWRWVQFLKKVLYLMRNVKYYNRPQTSTIIFCQNQPSTVRLWVQIARITSNYRQSQRPEYLFGYIFAPVNI
jgi:hypothetical protein